MMAGLLPRATLGAGAILRWHLVGHWLAALAGAGGLARVLDAGCGRGEYVVRIARRFPGARLVVGVDQAGRDGVSGFAEVPADVASRVLLREGPFSRAAVEDVAPFDALLCIDVLEHVPDDGRFLGDLAAVSRPGARGLVHVPATPQRHPLGWTRRELGRMLADGSGQHVRCWRRPAGWCARRGPPSVASPRGGATLTSTWLIGEPTSPGWRLCRSRWVALSPRVSRGLGAATAGSC